MNLFSQNINLTLTAIELIEHGGLGSRHLCSPVEHASPRQIPRPEATVQLYTRYTLAVRPLLALCNASLNS